MSRVLMSLAVVVALATTVTGAGEDRWEFGVRGILVTAGGEPANDMMSPGIYGEYRLGSGKWFVGGAFDQYAYDFETPSKIVRLVQDPAVKVIDADADATVISGWVGREYGRKDKRLHWTWSTGLGFSSPDVKDVTGPLKAGGTFNISTDPGSEVILSATGGLRQRLGERWSLQFGLRVDHHLADWKVRDRTSGNTGIVDDYTGLGGHLALGVRF